MRQTQRRFPWLALGLIVAVLPLGACQQTGEASGKESEAKEKPATVEKIEGTELSRLTLTAKAVERLDIKTADVREAAHSGSSAPRKIIPYEAVLYDATGATWVYTNPEARVYVRQRITIENIEGGVAILSDGPAAGAKVVTVGASLLFGTEFEFEEG